MTSSSYFETAPSLIKKPAGSNQAAPAARANIRLLLLPSGPDKIHSMTPHGTQSSSPTDWMIIAQGGPKCKLFFIRAHETGRCNPSDAPQAVDKRRH